jgi:hypothetical protein
MPSTRSKPPRTGSKKQLSWISYVGRHDAGPSGFSVQCIWREVNRLSKYPSCDPVSGVPMTEVLAFEVTENEYARPGRCYVPPRTAEAR